MFNEAVRCRPRSYGNIAVNLSGGLDSGSVITIASLFMRGKSERLIAFTSASMLDIRKFEDERFGNEFSLAKASARHAGNAELFPVTAEASSPIEAILKMLFILNAPDSSLSPTVRSPLEFRYRMLKPGGVGTGTQGTTIFSAHGLQRLDPTADIRVLAFILSVPDRIFIDPKTGLNSWLIREAMKGRLPDEVRLKRSRGLQAAGLVPRLRVCADEVETALDELARGAASAYVNVPYMRARYGK